MTRVNIPPDGTSGADALEAAAPPVGARRTVRRPTSMMRILLLAVVLGLVQPFLQPHVGFAGPSAAAQDLASVDQLVEWAGSGDGEDARRLRDAVRQRAVAATPAAAATLWIQLLAVIGNVDGELAPVAVEAVGLGDTRQGRQGAELILESLAGSRGPGASDGPEGAAERSRAEASLLALAALLSDPQDPAYAAEIRERLVRDHPEAAETPEARLLLARFYLSSEERWEEGLRMLEELIIQSPGHPIAPEARRLYEAAGERNEDAGDGGFL